MIFAFLVVIFSVSWALTKRVRDYALSRSLIDVPNERSAHSVPTPRGGGVSIVFAFLLALICLGVSGFSSSPVLIALSGAGMLVAAIGFIDDHGHIAARWRLLGHFAAATWVMYWIDGMAPIELFGLALGPIWVGAGLGVFLLVWMLNLYNFMDGIDGLASIEAISVCLGIALIYWISGFEGLIWPPLLLAAAVTGFLCWNFPPARIFMGDAGSGFLGIILGSMALHSAWHKPDLFWIWMILLGVFITDATWTLTRRFIAGKKIYQAHNSHAYQKAARRWGHKKVTISVLVVNVLFLLPISILIMRGDLNLEFGICIAYSPLVLAAFMLRAGCESQ